jgi:hypothetical protein
MANVGSHIAVTGAAVALAHAVAVAVVGLGPWFMLSPESDWPKHKGGQPDTIIS